MSVLQPVLRPLLRPLSLSLTRAGVLPWTPRRLFALGEQGAWYDPSDLSTLFQDSAGTTPVTAVGQPVGLLKDKSGRGNHASQSTTTARPTLQQDSGGRYYLSFDGVDDELAVSRSLSAYPLTLACAAKVSSDTLGGLLSVYGGAPPYYEIGKTATALQFVARIRGATTAAVDSYESVGSLGSPHVLLASFSATSGDLIADGVNAGAAGSNNNAFGTTTQFRVGQGGLGKVANSFYGGIILARAMTAAETTSTKRYLANRSRVPR